MEPNKEEASVCTIIAVLIGAFFACSAVAEIAGWCVL